MSVKNDGNKINLIFISRLISTIADQLLLFLIPWVIYKITGSASMSGLSFALEWFPRALSFPLSALWDFRVCFWVSCCLFGTLDIIV